MRVFGDSAYYRNRWSERELVRDFPVDEVFIDGLHAMQTHFINNGVSVQIPVVQVMNTAHFMAAYMFSTTCSGDQMEYDCIADMSFGRDRKLYKLTIIVLAAMLARTEGFRARQCRNMLLANRDSDFDEGVTLYDRFLRSAEEHFAEEDFLIDTHTQIQKLITENEQLTTENRQLKYTITTMEKQQFNQYNIGTQNNYNGPVTINYNYSTSTAKVEDVEPVQEEQTTPHTDFFCRITKQAIETGHAQVVEDELRSAAVSAPKLVKAIRTNEALGYLDTQNLSSVELYNLLNEHYNLPFKVRVFQTYRTK